MNLITAIIGTVIEPRINQMGKVTAVNQTANTNRKKLMTSIQQQN